MTTLTIPIVGMGCVNCAVTVEKELLRLAGVKSAAVNYAGACAKIVYDPETVRLADMKDAVKAVGYDLIVSADNWSAERDRIEKLRYNLLLRNTVGAWLLAIPLMALSMFFMHHPYTLYICMFLSLAIMTVFGRSFFISGWHNAVKGSSNMDTLIALSVSITFLFSFFNTIRPMLGMDGGFEGHVYYETAGVIISFVLLGRLLESRARQKASSAIRSLTGLQPQTARRLSDDGEEEVKLSALMVGDRISIRAGEKIPVDGLITQGYSSINESMLSGEALPVDKGLGDSVYAGTINLNGAFVMEARSVGESTVLGNIIKTVQEAQGSKAPVQRLADRVCRIFVPSILAVSFLTLIIWALVSGDIYRSVMPAVSVLVIACPCALGLATPIALIVGMGKAASSHILIKDACALENLCRINTFVFDKTGTLTEEKARALDCIWLVEDSQLYRDILYSAEKRAIHHIASAITDWLADANCRDLEPEKFENISGAGIQMEVNGKLYWVGNRSMPDGNGATIPETLETHLQEWEDKAYSIAFFGEGQTLIMAIAISVQLKPEADSVIKSLKQMGLELHILTGDSERSARRTASTLGISNWKAEAMPADKSDYVCALKEKGKVAMVGDGVNDSQALAQADLSIAMGKGTDVAMDVAMVTLTTSDLSALPLAINISRQTTRLIRENLFWAFSFNLIGIPLAAGALYPAFGLMLNPMIASAAMAFSSLAVALNSLRLKIK